MTNIQKQVKDSGTRYTNNSGGQRDSAQGKPKFKYIPLEILSYIIHKNNGIYSGDSDILPTEQVLDAIYSLSNEHEFIQENLYKKVIFTLIYNTGQYNTYRGLKKFALFMEQSAKKYTFQNWKLLNTMEDLKRFKQSAIRHYVQHSCNEMDQFHIEATVFNIMCIILNKFQ